VSEFRTERDSMGDVKVPAQRTTAPRRSAPWTISPSPANRCRAASSPRSAWSRSPPPSPTADLGKLKPDLAEPIVRAAREVAAGKLDDQFPIDVLPNRIGYVVEHERQRGHRQPRHRNRRRQSLRR